MRTKCGRRPGMRVWVTQLLLCVVAGLGRAQPAPSVEGALAALRQAGADVAKQSAALRSLGALGAAAEDALVAELANGDRQIRLNAILALGRLRSTRALEPLLTRCREDVDAEVRGGAAEALGRLGDPRAVTPLVGQLTGATADPLDRRGAAVALGNLHATEAVDPLIRLLESPNWEERWRAAVALGQIGDPRARAALAQLAGDTNAVVAGCASWAASVLVHAPDVKALERNLQGADDAVTWGTAWALGVIGTTGAVEALLGALKNGSPAAQAASRTVLAWLGMPMADAPTPPAPAVAPPPAATPAPASAPAPAASPVAATTTLTLTMPAGGGPLPLEERWTDRYGKLDLEISRPVVLSSRAARPALGAHARPCLYHLPNSDLLLLIETDPASAAAPRLAFRSADGGQTWQSEPTLVHRVAAVAALRNRTVLVYDQYLFQKEGQRFANDLCVSRDGGRSFGPLQLAEVALPVNQAVRGQPKEVVDAYRASSARWSERACPTFAARVVEVGDDSLAACGLSRLNDAPGMGAVCYRSGDHGLTWAAGATLARDEVSAVALASGGGNRLVALLTIGNDPALHAVFSADGGVAWSEPRGLRLAGATADLCRLPSGVLACCYGGPGLSLAFSIDGTGKSWTDKVRVAEAREGVSGWASLCEAGPDRLLLVYEQQAVFPDLGATPTAALCAAYITARRPAAAGQ